MDEGGVAANEQPATRDWIARWWLVLANLLVANALSLHIGPGGLRTPSTAINLWFAALLLLVPLLRRCWRKFGRPAGGCLAKAAVVVTLVLCLAVAAFAGGSLLGIAVLFALAALRQAPVFAQHPSLWLWLLACVIVVLSVDAMRSATRRNRPARLFDAVRAFAWLPPCGMLSVLLVLVPVAPRTWIGGRDPMFEPVSRVDDGWRSYVAVRSDPMAFTKPMIWVLATTPIVPGVLGWWSGLCELYPVGVADLRIEGDELCVDYHDYRSREYPRPQWQRRIRIR